MNESDRKLLTEWLGDIEIGWFCPHCNKSVDGKTVTYDELHEECGYAVYNPSNRHFTSPADFFAVRDRLVELGEWEDFDEWAFMKWDSQVPFNDLTRHIGEFTNLLASKTEDGTYRLCELCVNYLKEKEGNDV